MGNEYYQLGDDPNMGKAMMSLEAIGSIAMTSIRNVKGAYALKKDSDTCRVKQKNDELIVDVNVKVNQGANVAKVCGSLQKEIYDHILEMTGIKAKAVNIEVVGFITKEEATA